MPRTAAYTLPAWALALALAAWAPAGSAGTADAPEVTDAVDDHAIAGVVPLEGVGQFVNADVVAAWVEDAGADLLVTIQVQGSAAPTTTTNYGYTVHMDVGGTAYEATAALGAAAPVGSGAIEPGGVATAATNGDSLIVLTVPKEAIGASAGTVVTGLYVEAEGTPVTEPLTLIEDRAPDEGFGADYVVGGGNATAGDSDGDGLNDTREQEQFGGLDQNGTGDPDGDGLNNSAEFEAGTNATDDDTDGDGVADGEDSHPLDPALPGGSGNGTGNGTGGSGNATEDLDGDGLPDAWEREHFNSTSAQGGEGDPDADELDNAAEHAAGTDPNDPDTDGDGLSDATDPEPASASSTRGDRVELYAGAPLFAAIATVCLFGLARRP